MQFHSQCGQDKYLFETFFKDKQDGTYLDIGAHDGITISNSLFFSNIGWKGICVEPNKDVFQKLIVNRPNSICLNVCVGKNEMVNYRKITGYAEMLSGIVSEYDQRHEDRIKREISMFGGDYTMEQIESKTIDSILDENNFKKIDFCSIDVEGGEFNILSNSDFSKFDIDIFIIENNYGENKVRELMESNGYSYIQNVDSDQVFKKNK